MIYICIPTYNEQQTIGVVLWKLRQVLTGFPRDYQLLVADDASTDKTVDVLEPYTRVLPLTVIRPARRLGQAASLEMLLREAVRRSEYPKRDVIVTLQADFSDEPEDIVPLIKRLEAGADVALGNRVSSTPYSRTRRMSRTLARFFARGPKWPEGMDSPFDGFRAYRLYSVRRALDDARGRLVRYDGWAGQAELLQRVLPHARRVDMVTVVDRTDRLQRERREQPFAAAMEVRAMRRGADPAGLVPADELDRIAATASHSRDGALLLDEAAQQARAGGRSNGGRSRERTREGRARNGDGRGRSGEGRTRSDEPRAKSGGGAAVKRDRPKEEQSARAASGERKRRRGGRNRDAATEQPRAGGAETAAEQETVAPAAVDTIAGTETGTPQDAPRPKKKRRRRRRRSGSSGGSQETGANATDGASAAHSGGAGGPRAGVDAPRASGADSAQPEGGAGADDGSASGEPGTSARKRRRRGGRRGGRGRKRGPRREAGADAEGSTADTPADSPDGNAAARTDAVD